MVEKEVEVLNTHGIHARPSSLIVQAALKFKCSISIIKNGATADAKSIMSVMMLAATAGSKVIIRANGADEKPAIEALATLFANKFNEE
jgi:phosphocarrier protein HPr